MRNDEMMNDEGMRLGRVGVVIPVHNRRVMLRRAVESVLGQTYKEFDLVVVDDASDEDLCEVRDWVEASGHRWLRLEQQVGPAEARNRGAQWQGLAKNEWLAFLDSDDVWVAEKLQHQLRWHQRHEQSRISQCEESWVRKGVLVKKKVHQLQPQGEIFENCVRSCCISPSCVMMKRELWQELGGFDARFPVCEDYELWLRVALAHPVGLVLGETEPLVIRHGGHADQLSFALPAMDRFRVWALLKLMNTGGLSEAQLDVVEQGILQRAVVLAKGAKKRGKDEAARVYGRAQKGEWIEMEEEMRSLCC
ncbi:MAG: glycosyltransferase family 2 protein [Verrucomicrobiales bacterium]|nr:glycosyltransferase family 2 protein [Verrucomicrobiales bacterium]